MMSCLLNMKLKNCICLTLFVGGGLFLVIYYLTQSTPRDFSHVKKHHGISIDDVYIEEVMDPSNMKPDTFLFDASHYEKLLNTSNRGGEHVPWRSDYAQKILDGVPAAASIFSTHRMPTDTRQWPAVGNGHIATVVDSDTVYMNGLYNGYKGDSHRARIPSMVAIKMTPLGPFTSVKTTYSLDVGQGLFNETITTPYFEIEKLVYAHRHIKELLVVDIRIQRWDIGTPLTVLLKLNHGPDSQDIEFGKPGIGKVAETVYLSGKTRQAETNTSTTSDIHIVHTTVPHNISLHESLMMWSGIYCTWWSYLSGKTRQAETNTSTTSDIHIVHTTIPHNISLHESLMMWSGIYMMAISNTEKRAKDAYDLGLHFVKLNALRHMHITEWGKIWREGRIDVEGDIDIARMNYAALYYILSSLPSYTDSDWPFVGLSPCGLANGGKGQDYWGHVLWDQDTWMYPSILLLHTRMSETILKTRLLRLQQAKDYAQATGYKGARFPWEVASTGTNVCKSDTCAKYEYHISGDIALAIKQYLYLTNNTDFLLKNHGIETITEIGHFWVSKARYNPATHKYEIHDVMPPDEWHSPVNNSAYTNSIASLSLHLASYALNLVGQKAPEEFTTVADNMYVPFDARTEYHPEYDGYKIGTEVKQADVVLLGYPLEVKMSTRIRRNDLLLYEKATTKNGPAMTWQAFSIGWFEVKDTVKGEAMFSRWKNYVNGPFKVWSEEAGGGGCVNFQTGMGGYLQSVIYGYLGFRVHRSNLQLNPVLPTNVTRIRVIGVDYLNNSLNFLISDKNIKITLIRGSTVNSLEVGVPGHFEKHRLRLNQAIVIVRGLIYISPTVT